MGSVVLVIRVAMTSDPVSCFAHKVLFPNKLANKASALQIVRERRTLEEQVSVDRAGKYSLQPRHYYNIQ